MTSILTPQVIVIAYWLVMVVLSAFFLRLACSLCRAGMPTWLRAVVSVFVVSLLAYLTFDFTCYLIMRSMQDVLIRVPPGYGYSTWFREPIGLKLLILSHAGPLHYLPYVFALCAAGVLQVVVLQADVTFRWGLLIVVLQWITTIVAGYIVSLLLGVLLSAIGWNPQPVRPQEPPQAGRAQPPPKQGTAARRPRTRGEPAPPPEAPGLKQTGSESTTLEVVRREVEAATENPQEYFDNAAEVFKDYANSSLDEFKEEMAPVTQHLPEPVQNFLDRGGWWGVLGVLVFLALLWLRSIVRRLVAAVSRPKKRKKKHKAKAGTAGLRTSLRQIGEALSEEGPQQVTVKGMPARLRLVILSPGSTNAGNLSEDMADRVLDWIKPGLALVASSDYPRVRVWPPFYSAGGFTTAVTSNVMFPEPKGQKSRWVVVSGQVKMARSVIHVVLGLHADEANTLREVPVKGERWQGVVGLKKVLEPAGYR